MNVYYVPDTVLELVVVNDFRKFTTYERQKHLNTQLYYNKVNIIRKAVTTNWNERYTSPLGLRHQNKTSLEQLHLNGS